MIKKIILSAALTFVLYFPCHAVTTVQKLVDDFSALNVVEQQKLSQHLAGTSIYTDTVVTDVTEPGFIDRFFSKLYYKVTSEIMTSPQKRKEFKVIYCYTDGNKAMSYKKGDRIKAYGKLMKIEAGMFWIAVWLNME